MDSIQRRPEGSYILMESEGSGTASAMRPVKIPLHDHNHPPQQRQQQQLFHDYTQQQQFLPYPSLQPQESDHNSPQSTTRHAYAAALGGGPTSRAKQQPQQSSLSNEEEPTGFGDDAAAADTAKLASRSPSSASPWQRMKWTDSMIRLLIKVVYCVGDDAGGGGGGEGGEHQLASSLGGGGEKGKKGSASAGIQQQKKGKWKSVSRAMMERGYYVSPQQCEDKFNDLNKRYKRVNDLLGRGTACRVVENQSLLDSMNHLTTKAKEEARKLLNSKHLFFREMCAYHNGAGASTCAQTSNATSLMTPRHPQQEDQQRCFHHPPDPVVSRCHANAALDQVVDDHEGISADEEHEEDDDSDHNDEEEDGYNDEDDYEDEEDDADDHFHCNKHQLHYHQPQQQQNLDEEGDDRDQDCKGPTAQGSTFWAGAKRPKRSLTMLSSSPVSPSLALTMSSPAYSSTSMQHLRSELTGIVAGLGGGGCQQQQRQWLRKRAAELEEQRVGLQCRAFELERQRFKWLRFSSNKERELERSKLENERLRLENERMLLLLRQKEVELFSGSGPVAFLNAGNAQQQQQPSIAASNSKRYTTN